MPVRFWFDFGSIPLWFGLILVRYQFDSGSIPVQLISVQFRSNTGSILVQFHLDSGSIPVRFRFDSVRFWFDSSSILVWFRFDSSLIPVQFFYEKFRLSYKKHYKCVCSAAVRVDTLALASLKKTNWMKFTHEIIFPAASFLHVSLILWQLPKLGCGRHWDAFTVILN